MKLAGMVRNRPTQVFRTLRRPSDQYQKDMNESTPELMAIKKNGRRASIVKISPEEDDSDTKSLKSLEEFEQNDRETCTDVCMSSPVCSIM